jgi:geranylgeranyl reductase family protein
MEKLDTKICIIGAGPAGAATAVFLGKENIKHIIVDAASFPRDKICGDGLDLKAITMLNHVDTTILQNEIKEGGNIEACWGFRLINPKGKYTEFVFKPEKGNENKPPYGVSKRFALDNILVDKMNKNYSTFLQETKAIKIERIGNKWKIIAQQKDKKQIEINCDLLVGADGDHSVVLKHIGERKINRAHYAGGVRQYWKGIQGIHEKNLMEVYYPKKYPMSYFWIFPLGNGLANVGYGILSDVAAKNNYNIREIFTDLIKTDTILKTRFSNATSLENVSGWGLPLASLRRKCSGNGWILVGDAASMISPTTGEGVGTGMQTGFIAAKFIKKAVTENTFDETIFKNYDREIYRRMEDDIKLFKLSMWFSPKMMGWVMNNIVPFNYFKTLFQKKVGQWLNTAYNKEIKVTLE